MPDFKPYNVLEIVETFAIQADAFFNAATLDPLNAVKPKGTLFLPFKTPYWPPVKPGRFALPDHLQMVLICRNGADMPQGQTGLRMQAVCKNSDGGPRLSAYGKSGGAKAAVDALSQVFDIPGNGEVEMLPLAIDETPFAFQTQPVKVGQPVLPFSLYNLRTTELTLKL